MSTPVAILLAIAAPFLAAAVVAMLTPLYLLWRDRHGHPKDNRPVGATSDERYAHQAARELWLERDQGAQP